jgi:Pyruvate/2-oxoacid:ferredoxin oxidoreductase delta subunit
VSATWLPAAHEPGALPSPTDSSPAVPPISPEVARLLSQMLGRDRAKRDALVSGRVVAEASRCVECGICTYNCPIGIDVRSHARQGIPVADSHCLTCGECVGRCPRGTLRFEESTVFAGGPRGAG